MFGFLIASGLSFNNVAVGISSVYPDKGPSTGGERVVIKYNGSLRYISAICRFDNHNSAAESVTYDSVYCRSPPHKPGVVELQVSFTGSDWYEQPAFNYTYIPTSADQFQVWFKISIIIILGLLLFGGIVYISLPLCSGVKSKALQEEKKPLIPKNEEL